LWEEGPQAWGREKNATGSLFFFGLRNVWLWQFSSNVNPLDPVKDHRARTRARAKRENVLWGGGAVFLDCQVASVQSVFISPINYLMVSNIDLGEGKAEFDKIVP